MRKYVKVSTKRNAITHFKENNSKRQTAHVCNVAPKQIREWVRTEEKLRRKAAFNTKARSSHKRR